MTLMGNLEGWSISTTSGEKDQKLFSTTWSHEELKVNFIRRIKKKKNEKS